MMEVTPHLKSVLKNYQHSALRSLQGPGLSNKYDLDLKDEEFLQPVVRAHQHQQVPILAAADNSSSERTETSLEGETISCFVVGGEKRLCLPQILNSVLRDFSLNQINQECDKLQIFCSRCSLEQLNVLKSQGILPSAAPSCGLITKTDAERLCSALLHDLVKKPLRVNNREAGKVLNFSVYHECFGKCRGLCFPELYVNKDARCIECCECQGAFSPQHFVLHGHGDAECRTVHWGFDSTMWRAYVLVSENQMDHEQYFKYLDEMRDKYEGKRPFTPPPPQEVTVNPLKKKMHPEDLLKLDIVDIPLKKNKLEEFAHIPYTPTANPANLWALEPIYLRFLQESCFPANRQLSAFKPFIQSIKESKLKHSAASYNNHARYADPPVLQHPERVVPISQTERFEGGYQPNVALAPHMSKKHRYIRQHIEQTNQQLQNSKDVSHGTNQQLQNSKDISPGTNLISQTTKDFRDGSNPISRENENFIKEVPTCLAGNQTNHVINNCNSSNHQNQNLEKESKESFPSPNEVSSTSAKLKYFAKGVAEDSCGDRSPGSTVINKVVNCDTEQNFKNANNTIQIQKSPDSQNIIDSTVSVVQSTGNLTRYNSEIELSTDTEDSASEADKKPEFSTLEELLKEVEVSLKDKILEAFKSLAKDHEHTLRENKMKDGRINELELNILELKTKVKETERKFELERNKVNELQIQLNGVQPNGKKILNNINENKIIHLNNINKMCEIKAEAVKNEVVAKGDFTGKNDFIGRHDFTGKNDFIIKNEPNVNENFQIKNEDEEELIKSPEICNKASVIVNENALLNVNEAKTSLVNGNCNNIKSEVDLKHENSSHSETEISKGEPEDEITSKPSSILYQLKSIENGTIDVEENTSKIEEQPAKLVPIPAKISEKASVISVIEKSAIVLNAQQREIKQKEGVSEELSTEDKMDEGEENKKEAEEESKEIKEKEAIITNTTTTNN